MNLAVFDPSTQTQFTDLMDFRVAFYDMLDEIESHHDLDIHFEAIPEVRSYHPMGAIRQAYHRRPQPLMASVIPGDYFIVSAPKAELIWRYTVIEGRPIGGVPMTDGVPFTMMKDPFGELLQTWRGEYFSNCAFGEAATADDCDMSDYFTNRRELLVTTS